jgi:arginase
MKIRLIEVPIDFGASRRGVDIGPTALRLAGIKDALQAIGHEVEEDKEPIFVPIQEQSSEYNPKLKFLPEIKKACETLAERVDKCAHEGCFPLVMGGDHSIAMGSIAGLSAFYRERGIRFGVVWIDAHGDFNTVETTPSGNIHGMPLAASAGLGAPELTGIHGSFRKVDPEHIVLIGIRDLDPGEKDNLRKAGVKAYTMMDIDRKGIYAIMDEALDYLNKRVDVIHASFDIDSIDPEHAPGVGTPVQAGLTYREALCVMETLAKSGLVGSADLVEVNPILDVRNQTADMAVRLLSSLLGATIL